MHMCHLHSCGMQLIPPDLQVSISLRCFKRGLPAQNSGWATHAELRYAEKLLTSCASQPSVRELRVSRPASWNPRSDNMVYYIKDIVYIYTDTYIFILT
jgi:hypothetical protein